MASKKALIGGFLTFCILACGEEPTVEEFHCTSEYTDPICQEVPDGGDTSD